MQTAFPQKEEVTREYRGLVLAISHRMIQDSEIAKDAARGPFFAAAQLC